VHSNLPLAMVDAWKKSKSQELQLSISGIIQGYHHYCVEVSVGYCLQEEGNAETRLQLLTIMGS